ncbi:MAG: XdhC family protein [Marinosulfonomonas sp.]|nr:XdhC family protein [Marinosulfonomonas sp.]
MTQHFDDIPETALAWHRAGRGAVLATVVETWGSAPRPVGSQLVIAADGEIAGSVSGGCVEGAVIIEAQDALEDGKPRMLEFGVPDDQAFAVGLACGGRIRVMIEPVGAEIPEAMLTSLVAARKARQAIAYIVNTSTWTRHLQGTGRFLRDRFRADRSGFEGEEFIAIHNPPLKLIVIGAVHIAQPLLVMARLAGYAPVLVDPRSVFGSKARFPNEQIIDDWPDVALSAQGLDARTAVVTLSHDPKFDDPAIITALGSDVFYIGCLGSTRTHSKRVARLTGAGITPDQLQRIHAPVGLDIGSKSPSEIAISIMAQITQCLRKPQL